MAKKTAVGKTKRPDIVSQDFTINMGKRLYKMTFNKRAGRAVSEIKKFAEKMMGTKDVRIDPALNQHLWSRGIQGVPRRIRIRCHRKKNEDEDAKEKLYTLVQYLEVASFKGLMPEIVHA